MPGSRFEFDENGDTFLCFLVAFYTIILIPVTYFFWPSFENRDGCEQGKRKCLCSPCQVKRLQLKLSTPVKKLKKILLHGAFFVAWVIFFLLIYRLTLIETIEAGFDPFSVLEIDRDASTKEIRQAYKRLSLKHHPDKQGDEKQFILISKAYSSLTNKVSRKNWEEYGNPDGPRAAHFGIALPKWMIEKENFYLVIGAYVFLFMLLLPIGVGTWWYNTMRFTNSRVLLGTVRDFCYAFRRSPYMAMPRVIKVLSNAHEFDQNHNKEVVSRPSDNLEVPPLILQIPKFTIFKKAIVGSPSSIKARALIYAHLERLDLPQNTLHLDRQYVIKHSPRLIEEMINCLLYMLAVALEESDARHKTPQHLITMENCMHLVPMLIQAISDPSTPLLQLPHIGTAQLRHMSAKQRNIKSIRQLVRLPEDKRRGLFRGLSDENYRDILNVCANMPTLEVNYQVGISGEEDQTIWSLTMVTVNVHLKRLALLDLTSISIAAGSASTGGINNPQSQHYSENTSWSKGCTGFVSPKEQPQQLYAALDVPTSSDNLFYTTSGVKEPDGGETMQVKDSNSDEDAPTTTVSSRKQAPVWDRSKKRKPARRGGGGKQRKHQQQQQQSRNQTIPASSALAAIDRKQRLTVPEVELLDGSDCGDHTVFDNQFAADLPNAVDSPENVPPFNPGEEDDGDEDVAISGNNAMDSNSAAIFARKPSGDSNVAHCTHLVHCPYFPIEKFEAWWIYIVERRTRQLITRPVYFATLQTEDVVTLRFVAPAQPGTYMYTLCVRSDSYVDCDFLETIRFTVKPIPEGVIRLLEKQEVDDEDDSGEDEDLCDEDDESADGDGNLTDRSDDDGDSSSSENGQHTHDGNM